MAKGGPPVEKNNIDSLDDTLWRFTRDPIGPLRRNIACDEGAALLAAMTANAGAMMARFSC